MNEKKSRYSVTRRKRGLLEDVRTTFASNLGLISSKIVQVLSVLVIILFLNIHVVKSDRNCALSYIRVLHRGIHRRQIFSGGVSDQNENQVGRK